MARRAMQIAAIPDSVTDETIIVPLGETKYWLLLSDEEVELMAQGICPERVAVRAYDCLGWKREAYRVAARAPGGAA